MDQIVNAIRREMARGRGNAPTQHGLVTSYDPNAFAVKVALQPSGKETGWIPLASPWIGNGWGVFFAPSVGDQIVVEFQEGAGEVPVAMLRLFDNQNRPLAVPSGEMWMVHQRGSFIKLTNDGSIDMSAPAGMIATTPSLSVTGNVSVGAGATGVFSSSTGQVITVANGIITNID